MPYHPVQGWMPHNLHFVSRAADAVSKPHFGGVDDSLSTASSVLRHKPSWGEHMGLDRLPLGTWGWRPTLLLVVFTVTPLLVVLQLVPQTRTITNAAQVNDLLSYLMVLMAGLCLYVYWRLAGPSSASWLVAAAVLFSVQGLAFAGLRIAHQQDVRTSPGWPLIIDQALALVVLAIVVQANRAPARTDPLTLGLSLGLLFGVVRVGLAEGAPQFALEAGLQTAMVLCIAGTNLLTVRQVLKMTEPPRWARQRLAVGVVLLAFSHAIIYPTPEGELRSLAAIVTDLLGVIIVVGTALAMARMALGEHRHWVASLRDKLAQMEAGLRVDRARLHEVGSTIAGIASAWRLMHDFDGVSPAQRRRLERTIDCEMARLERLMSTRVGGPLLPVDLDGTLEPVVVAHQARGQKLVWEPSGQWARGRADDIAEVVNILLENAAQHANGAVAWVKVRPVNESIEISVADSGPGVPEAVKQRMFEWGSRGDGSPGQGIGLHVAQRLVADQGGSLSVASASARGACLVVTLPATQPRGTG